MASGRCIAIGDIHGCRAALDALLAAIQPRADDCLVTLGDYVDRGPDSCGVIDRLIQLTDECELVPLLGNHELMFLGAFDSQAVREFWLQCGGDATLASYGGSWDAVPVEHQVFLRGCRRGFETETHLFLHANYDPELTLAQQSDEVVLWKHLVEPVPPHRSGKTVVVGHTPQLDGDVLHLGHVVCIDTGCFAGGWLTAWDVRAGTIWQADLHGRLRP